MMEAGEKAVEIDPNDGKTHLRLSAWPTPITGKPEQALAEFDRAETLSPSDADLLLVDRLVYPSLVKRNGP